MYKKLVVYTERCVGCRICEIVCSMEKEGKINPWRARVHVLSSYPEGIDFPVVCLQCKIPLCIDACGRGAINRDGRTGAVTIDRWDCNGCGKCVTHCPQNAIFFHAEDEQPIVCDLCKGNPTCVKYCPTQALQYLTLDEVQRRGRMAMLERMVSNATAGGQ